MTAYHMTPKNGLARVELEETREGAESIHHLLSSPLEPPPWLPDPLFAGRYASSLLLPACCSE